VAITNSNTVEGESNQQILQAVMAEASPTKKQLK